MLPAGTKTISVDDHLIEPKDLWTSRVSKKYGDAIPHIVEVDGVDVWTYDGELYPTIMPHTAAGRPPEEWNLDPISYRDMRSGAYDAKARLDDMDKGGIYGSVCFPTFSRFAGHRFLEGSDRGLALECVRAYNDFMLEEWCGAAPDRLYPLVLLPLWDAKLAEGELHRTAALGAKAVAFTENPSKLGLPSIHSGYWDVVYRAAEETGLPICMHIGSSGSVPNSSDDSPQPVHVCLHSTSTMMTVADYCFSHVLESFPDLKLMLSEGGAGWVPFMLERMDQAWRRHGALSNVKLTRLPSEAFAAHMWVCLVIDKLAIDLRHTIGVERITWESDYPHADSLWPESRTVLEDCLRDVPEREAVAIAETNARQVLRI